MLETKPVILGSGIAGLSAAIAMAPLPVVVLTRKLVCESSSSMLAQGGIAAAMGVDDNTALHEKDTLSAGVGLCDPEIVQLVTSSAPKTIRQLCEWGVNFDRDKNGNIDFGLEGAHGHRRIVHAEGDRTGAAVMQAFAAKIRTTPSITVIENATATELLTNNGIISGVRYINANGQYIDIATRQVLLATGGAGDLWLHTTNPSGSYGRGIALAARAGAELRDMEFMQFHPTAIDVNLDPLPLASEALRGEGAVLINDLGDHFMAAETLGDLSPRDLVTRHIWMQLERGRKVFLDARNIDSFAKHFPAIYSYCMSSGINPELQPIPVLPAAHYHMGGVATDACGRTNVKGLWACGEVASTGLHGANRLASNSLLESIIFGMIAAKNISYDWVATAGKKPLVGNTTLILPRSETLEERAEIRSIMSNYVGVLRNKTGLQTAINCLSSMAQHSDMALVGLLIASAAHNREESRGAHFRSDFPEASDEWKHHQTFSLKEIYCLPHTSEIVPEKEEFIDSSIAENVKTKISSELCGRGFV